VGAALAALGAELMSICRAKATMMTLKHSSTGAPIHHRLLSVGAITPRLKNASPMNAGAIRRGANCQPSNPTSHRLHGSVTIKRPA
jgi:hypothetical protein